MREVVKKEVLKLLHAGIIYPMQDSEWVSPVQVVPKKGVPRYCFASFHPTSKKAFVELSVWNEKEAYLHCTCC
jgi:hypothetical protein